MRETKIDGGEIKTFCSYPPWNKANFNIRCRGAETGVNVQDPRSSFIIVWNWDVAVFI